jgi:ankyrin repeat protein
MGAGEDNSREFDHGYDESTIFRSQHLAIWQALDREEERQHRAAACTGRPIGRVIAKKPTCTGTVRSCVRNGEEMADAGEGAGLRASKASASSSSVVSDAIRRGRPLAEIRAIVDEQLLRIDPQCLTRPAPGSLGHVPLHEALSARLDDDAPRLDLVRYLVENCPASVRIRTAQYGYLPVHMAVIAVKSSDNDDRDGAAGLATVQLLLKHFPEALHECTGEPNESLLHLALGTFEFPWEYEDHPSKPFRENLVRYLIQTMPASALAERDRYGSLPFIRMLCCDSGLAFGALSLVLDPYPEALHSTTSGDGCLPLHMAASNDALPPEVLRELVLRSPDAVRARTSNGRLPLHLAAAYGRHVESVRCLVEHYPEAIQVPDRNGNLPLLLAVTALSVEPDVVRFLAEQWPGALRVKGRDGDLPVHAVAKGLGCLEPLRVLSEAWPDSLLERDDLGRTPLHAAVYTIFWSYEFDYPPRRTLEPVRYLIGRMPRALQIPDHEGRLPLHTVLREEGSAWPRLVRLLAEGWTGALRVRAREGQLPMHLAASLDMPDNVRTLGALWPGALRIRDGQGRLPLHRAVSVSSHAPLLRQLVRNFPGSLGVRDDDGCLPLHTAAADTGSLEVVQLLVEHRPGALRERNSLGQLPVHVYVSRMCYGGVDVARLLVRRFPESTLVRDNRGDLPLHAALRSAAPTSIVRFLLEERPETLRKTDYDGNLPVHIAVLDGGSLSSPPSGRASCDSTKNRMSNARLLVEQWPWSLRVRGNRGRVVLHWAARWSSRTLGVRLDRRFDDDARDARNKWLAFLEFLVRQWPGAGALHVRDAARCLPPLLHAAAAATDDDDDDDDSDDTMLDAVYLLLRARPEQVLLPLAGRGNHSPREDRKRARPDES